LKGWPPAWTDLDLRKIKEEFTRPDLVKNLGW
jgi:hypothetical protein